jgi:hypothetical protein
LKRRHGFSCELNPRKQTQSRAGLLEPDRGRDFIPFSVQHFGHGNNKAAKTGAGRKLGSVIAAWLRSPSLPRQQI